MYVVTDATSFTLPEIPGLDLGSERELDWLIESHGEFASVDDMCDPDNEGFLDAYSGDGFVPMGRRTGDGSYTVSGGRWFTTAP
jgi:hypothetical protein